MQNRPRAPGACLSRVPRRVARTVLRGPGHGNVSRLPDRTIRMPKLRIKVSGCMRTLAGARDFAAIRSYTATAIAHGHNMLNVLIQAAARKPWTPTTT